MDREPPLFLFFFLLLLFLTFPLPPPPPLPPLPPAFFVPRDADMVVLFVVCGFCVTVDVQFSVQSPKK